MKTKISVGGAGRLAQTAEQQRRLAELRREIAARYAAELSRAGIFRRWVLHWHQAAEFRRERRKLEPSSDALF
jgi:hypothetical protein